MLSARDLGHMHHISRCLVVYGVGPPSPGQPARRYVPKRRWSAPLLAAKTTRQDRSARPRARPLLLTCLPLPGAGRRARGGCGSRIHGGDFDRCRSDTCAGAAHGECNASDVSCTWWCGLGECD
ncbi:hypothetical protein [Oryza sativa Japonica Group]|uniref:Uncharacterized protein n=1 Tax=Oryza sativa subsp. japonica TaxID=39947 RepID=Q5ZEB1_ORYSJ|nr:hypothetical protein [Oryza sativa Japonica Group]